MNNEIRGLRIDYLRTIKKVKYGFGLLMSYESAPLFYINIYEDNNQFKKGNVTQKSTQRFNGILSVQKDFCSRKSLVLFGNIDIPFGYILYMSRIHNYIETDTTSIIYWDLRKEYDSKAGGMVGIVPSLGIKKMLGTHYNLSFSTQYSVMAIKYRNESVNYKGELEYLLKFGYMF